MTIMKSWRSAWWASTSKISTPLSSSSSPRDEFELAKDDIVIDILPSSSSNWDKLPKDILGLIFERLDLVDRIRLEVVCKAWRSSDTQTPQLLWLMLPYDRDEDCQHLTFFDMFAGKLRRLKLPEAAQGGWFAGSSKGWLFLAKDNLETFLFNPISHQQIPLPPLSTISKSKSKSKRLSPASRIVVKFSISSSPDASRCVVAILTLFSDASNSIIALCRPQDERWTIVEAPLPDGCGYSDILFSEQGKSLYAYLTPPGQLGNNFDYEAADTTPHIHPITLSTSLHHNDDDNDQVINLIPIPPLISFAERNRLLYAVDAEEKIWCLQDAWIMGRLVESDGQIWAVHQIGDEIATWADNDDNDNDNEDDNNSFVYHRTSRFEVWKLQIDNAVGFTITRVNNFGKGKQPRSLFVGCEAALLGLGASHQLDHNCIYFLENCYFRDGEEYPLFSRESGVFHLDGGRIKRWLPVPSTTQIEKRNFMTWFSPNIKLGSFY